MGLLWAARSSKGSSVLSYLRYSYEHLLCPEAATQDVDPDSYSGELRLNAGPESQPHILPPFQTLAARTPLPSLGHPAIKASQPARTPTFCLQSPAPAFSLRSDSSPPGTPARDTQRNHSFLL